MGRLIRAGFFLWCWLNALPFSAGGQTPVFWQLGPREGLKSRVVTAVLQDRRGYLWIGTDNGLQRYDGYRVVEYPRRGSLGAEVVERLLEDRQGQLWVASSETVTRLDPIRQTVRQYRLPTSEGYSPTWVLRLFEDGRGRIWLISRDNEPLVFSLQAGGFTPYRKQLPHWPAGLRDVVPDPARGGYWLAGADGLWFVKPAGSPAAVRPFPRDDLRKPLLSIALDRQRRLYLGRAENRSVRYYRLDLADSTLHALPELRNPESYHFGQDRQGVVWAASTQLAALRPGRPSFEPVAIRTSGAEEPVSLNRLFDLLEDREGTLWLATSKGLFFSNPARQALFREPDLTDPGLAAKNLGINGFIETPAGEIWAGSLAHGLLVFDRTLRHRRTVRSAAARHPVRCWVADRQGQIWGGDSQGGRLCVTVQTGETRYLPPAPGLSLSFRTATLLPTGAIGWGTEEGQLWRQPPHTDQLQPWAEPAAALRRAGAIRRLLTDPAGTLWVATGKGGVFGLNPQTGQVVGRYATDTPNRLESNEVSTIQWLSTNQLAIATRSGLYLANPRRGFFRRFTTADGLPGNGILNAEELGPNRVLVTTNSRLSVVNLTTRRGIPYGDRDGLEEAGFAFSASHRLRDGRVLLGTLRRFVSCDPARLFRPAHPAPVQITGFRVFDRVLPLDSLLNRQDRIRLGNRDNFFTIDFSTLQFYNDDQRTYTYKLEGVDPDWVRAGPGRSASYTGVPGGRYRFLVRAQDPNSPHPAPVQRLLLEIEQPFWKTNGFLAALVGAVLGLFYLAYRIRLSRLLALQRVRSRISRDLHDDMGSVLSTIHILSSMASWENDLNEVKPLLARITHYSQGLMQTMDDIVWSINPLNDSMQNLTARMRSFAADLLEARQIDFRMQVDESVNRLHLPLSVRYDCLLVFKETINNLAKYADATEVTIRISQPQKRMLEIYVEDNGRGFDPDRVRGGNGLTNLRNRAGAMGGQLRIRSAPGQGTTVQLRVPV